MIHRIIGKIMYLLKISEYCALIVEDNPSNETLKKRQIIIVGGLNYMKWVYLLCPCGCNQIIMLSLNKTNRPRWSIEIDCFGRPTIHPSINQLSGCKSHFWIKKGKVHWAK